MNLPEVLKYMYPTANFLTDIILEDMGEGPFIKHWNLLEVRQPTNEDIINALSIYDLQYRQLLVRTARKSAYPTWQQQMDMQYNDLINNTTTWKDAIEAIKVANPIPTE